jgi:hypothetical protein
MLTCEDVLDALPEIDGEQPEKGDLHDHLAACSSCAAEAESLRADLEVLRRDLAALAPTPFLEDGVMQSARTPAAKRHRAPALWIQAGIGAVAAALLVVVLVTSRATPPAGETDGETPAGPGEAEVLVDLHADGMVRVGGMDHDLADPVPALASLVEQLSGFAAQLGRREDDGTNDLVVRLRADAATPWVHMQWVMQTCAQPDVALSRLRFEVAGAGGGSIDNQLPRDLGIGFPIVDYEEQIKAVLHRRDGETWMKLRPEALGVAGPVRGDTLEALQEVARRVVERTGEAGVSVEISVPPGPGSERIPFADVYAILEALHAAGATHVLFEGSAFPR